MKKVDEQSIHCKEKFKKHEFIDPFPEILPSLLNPYDIKKYVDKVGMISPFKEENLKNPTYKVPLYGEIYWWDEDNDDVKKVELYEDNEGNDYIEIKPNSITYIHISTIFRVPYYLAFRFNLTVSLAQKGLLLGTGPIIDPGYEGRIMIPIHNLTDNQYNLTAGSGFIKVEVTKISNHSSYKNINLKNGYNDIIGQDYNDMISKNYKYKFPSSAKEWTATKYFSDININKPIRSSLPSAIKKSAEDSKSAKESAEKAEESTKHLSSIGTIALFAAVVTLGTFLLNVLGTMSNISDKVQRNTENNKQQINSLKEEIRKIKEQVNNIKK